MEFRVYEANKPRGPVWGMSANGNFDYSCCPSTYWYNQEKNLVIRYTGERGFGTVELSYYFEQNRQRDLGLQFRGSFTIPDELVDKLLQAMQERDTNFQ